MEALESLFTPLQEPDDPLTLQHSTNNWGLSLPYIFMVEATFPFFTEKCQTILYPHGQVPVDSGIL